MKIKTTSTFTLESEELAAIDAVINLLSEMMEECDEYVDSNLTIGDISVPVSTLNATADFLDYLLVISSASVSTANYEEDNEQLSFDDFENGEEDLV